MMITIDWDSPDHFFVALLIQGKDQVYGRVKNGYGLLEGIPMPGTGFYFKDVVTVSGPTGRQKFRDEEISTYEVGALYTRSPYKTFRFKAQLPDYDSFFQLVELFLQNWLRARVPWFDDNTSKEWKECLCTAETMEKAEGLLKQFLKKSRKARIIDIVEFG